MNGYITELNTRTDDYEKSIAKEMKVIQDKLAALPRVGAKPKW